MSRRARLGLFAVSAAGLAVLLLAAVAGLPDFGNYQGPYGTILNAAAPQERHVTNVVAAVVFDYRGFDTLGEEFILFAAAIGVALLLRDVREEDVAGARYAAQSDAVRLVGLGFAGALLVIGLYVVAHGYLTPGGGFQGGVVIASALVLVYLAGDYAAYRRLTPTPAVDFVKGVGAAAFAMVGVVALLLGEAYLHNFAPLGTTGKLASGGTIPILNLATALEVSCAFLLLFTEFLEEFVIVRSKGRR